MARGLCKHELPRMRGTLLRSESGCIYVYKVGVMIMVSIWIIVTEDHFKQKVRYTTTVQEAKLERERKIGTLAIHIYTHTHIYIYTYIHKCVYVYV